MACDRGVSRRRSGLASDEEDNEEIRIVWVGRGGQGAVTASLLAAVAFYLDGARSLSFPEFSVERRGAPVRAFTIVSLKGAEPLREPIEQADVLVVLDVGTALALADRTSLSPGALVVANASYAQARALAEALSEHGGNGIWMVEATRISTEHVGKPTVGVVMLGALSRALGAPSLRSAEEALSKAFSGRLLEKNREALRRGFAEARPVEVAERRQARVVGAYEAF